MTGTISDYLELKLLDHILKTAPFTVPTHIYIALSTADPTDDGSGLAEPSDGYARVVCDVWDAAASRATENTNEVAFPEATGVWGTITHWAAFDAITGGNMLAHGELTTSKVIGTGDNARFLIGDLDISFNSGGLSDYLANKLLDHVFKTTEFSVPANIYVALSDTTIADGTTGITISEPGANYARKLHNAYDAAVAGHSENTGVVTFIEASASWGTITDVALVDSLTAGNILLYAVLDVSKAVEAGDIAQFDDGAFDFTID